MARFLHSIYSFTIRKYDKFFLALSWAIGLGFGGFGFRYAGSDLASQMPLAAISQPSIFGLLLSSFLPLLFSALAVYIGAPWMMYGICFAKAFSFGYVSCAVFSVFGNAAWLVRFLLLFTDLWSAAAMYHYCCRHISGVRKFSPWGLAGYAGLLILACAVDHSFISPFLRRVLS